MRLFAAAVLVSVCAASARADWESQSAAKAAEIPAPSTYPCPHFVLECRLDAVNGKGGVDAGKPQTSPYVAFNDDEPSEAPNKCEANVTIEPAGSSTLYHGTLSEDLTLYLYAAAKGAYGVIEPQFSLDAVPNKPARLHLKGGTLVCVVKPAP